MRHNHYFFSFYFISSINYYYYYKYNLDPMHYLLVEMRENTEVGRNMFVCKNK